MPEIPAQAVCAKGKDEPKHSDTSSAVDRPGLLPLSLETTFSEGQNAHPGVMFPWWAAKAERYRCERTGTSAISLK